MLRTLIKQAASVAGLRAMGTGLSVAATVAIARLYGADSLGVYAYCIALMLISTVPITNGWSTMLLRAVSREGRLSGTSNGMARTGAFGALLFTALAALIGIVAIYLSSAQVADALKPIAPLAILLLAVAMISDQLSAMRMAAIRGINRPALAQLPESLVRPLVLLIGIGSCWLIFGANSLAKDLPLLFSSMAAAAIVSAVIGQIILIRISRHIMPAKIEPAERKSWVLSAGALAGSAGLVQLNGYADLLVLGAFVTPGELGQYRTAMQIAMLASFGYIALNMLAGQRFARFRELKDHEGMASTATYLSRLAILTAVPLPIMLIFYGDEIFALLFGSEFIDAALPALIVASGFTFSAAIGMARTLLVMHGKEFLIMRTTLLALALNVGLCLALIPDYGIVGAAIANCSAMVTWNILLWQLARHRTGFDTSAVGLPQRHLND